MRALLLHLFQSGSQADDVRSSFDRYFTYGGSAEICTNIVSQIFCVFVFIKDADPEVLSQEGDLFRGLLRAEGVSWEIIGFNRGAGGREYHSWPMLSLVNIEVKLP